MKGIEENSPSLNPEMKGTRGASPKTKSRNLLDRFIEYKEQILRFLTDLKVPFENNQAERDIRMMKFQQKISGTLYQGLYIRDFQGHTRSGNFLQD
jgi:transposase